MAAASSHAASPSLLHAFAACSNDSPVAEAPIVIVGRGIIGATVALRLAHARHKVVVVGSTPTQTNMAFGWLGNHQVGNTMRHMLNRLSRHSWEALLDTHLGRDGYVAGGCLMYAADESAGGMRRLEATAAQYRSRGSAVHTLSKEAITKLVPELASQICGAIIHPDDAVIDGKWAAARALERAAEYGADVRSGDVVGFERNLDGSVSGVRLSDGTLIACRSLVLAAGGKGIRELGSLLGIEIPVKGVWGIKVKTKPLSRRLVPGVAMLKHYSADCSASAGISYGQYPDNSFCINEKMMDGVDMDVRLREWLAYFASIWPELKDAEVAYMTKTVRWVAEDDGHICGYAPGPNSNVYVMMTNADGINMSAMLSEVAALEICGGAATGLMGHCLPGRFVPTSPTLVRQTASARAPDDGTTSGDGTVENVGMLVAGSFGCPDCLQKFGTEKAMKLHWTCYHDPNRSQED